MNLKKIKNGKGITLIVLVITITVMLILAGISLNFVINEDGITKKSVNAKKMYDISQAKEKIQILISKFAGQYYTKNETGSFMEYIIQHLENENDYTVVDKSINTGEITIALKDGTEVSGIVTGDGRIEWENFALDEEDSWTQSGTTVTNGKVTLEVGTEVSGYTSSTEVPTGTKWCVLGAQDGKLLITTNGNVSSLLLSGQNGYKNGIDMLNTVSKYYGNTSMADSVRSINVDDLNRVTGYNPETARSFAGTVWEYGNKVTYKLKNGKIYCKGSMRPIPAENEDQDGTETSYTNFTYLNGDTWTSLNSTNDTVTLTSTCYRYHPRTLSDGNTGDTKGIETTSLAYLLLFSNTNSASQYYWLASQSISLRKWNRYI